MKYILIILAILLTSCSLTKGLKKECPSNNCYKISLTTPQGKEYYVYADSTNKLVSKLQSLTK